MTVNNDGYPIYRCRRVVDGETVEFEKRGARLDNRWVVFYNPFLTRLFKIYVNVEVCATVSAIKYINKYIYKGHDKATMQINNEYNEIKRYIACRYVGPSQTYWDIMEFPTYKEYFTIYRLALYLPN